MHPFQKGILGKVSSHPFERIGEESVVFEEAGAVLGYPLFGSCGEMNVRGRFGSKSRFPVGSIAGSEIV